MEWCSKIDCEFSVTSFSCICKHRIKTEMPAKLERYHSRPNSWPTEHGKASDKVQTRGSRACQDCMAVAPWSGSPWHYPGNGRQPHHRLQVDPAMATAECSGHSVCQWKVPILPLATCDNPHSATRTKSSTWCNSLQPPDDAAAPMAVKIDGLHFLRKSD